MPCPTPTPRVLLDSFGSRRGNQAKCSLDQLIYKPTSRFASEPNNRKQFRLRYKR